MVQIRKTPESRNQPPLQLAGRIATFTGSLAAGYGNLVHDAESGFEQAVEAGGWSLCIAGLIYTFRTTGRSTFRGSGAPLSGREKHSKRAARVFLFGAAAIPAVAGLSILLDGEEEGQASDAATEVTAPTTTVSQPSPTAPSGPVSLEPQSFTDEAKVVEAEGTLVVNMPVPDLIYQLGDGQCQEPEPMSVGAQPPFNSYWGLMRQNDAFADLTDTDITSLHTVSLAMSQTPIHPNYVLDFNC